MHLLYLADCMLSYLFYDILKQFCSLIMDNIRLVSVPATFYWKFCSSLLLVYMELCAFNLFMTFHNRVLWIVGRSLLQRVARVSRILICCLPVSDPLVHSYLFCANICCSTTGFTQYFQLHTYTSLQSNIVSNL